MNVTVKHIRQKNIPLVTHTENGLMSHEDKYILDNLTLEGGSIVTAHADNGSITVNGNELVVYTLPASLPANMIILDSTHRFVTDVQIDNWDSGTGTPGTPGTNGVDGVDGVDGIDGKTAYEVAVINGFVGTQAQWLLSLKGSNGVDGVDGLPGLPGVDGEPGVPGEPGTPGLPGDTGLGFVIAKTYSSVTSLLNDTAPTGIIAGQFAVVSTANTNDLDNNKLYLWNGTVYSFITDLSGIQGIQGADGKSAYQLATTAGFVGTMFDWLASLKGANGTSSIIDWVGDLTEPPVAVLNKAYHNTTTKKSYIYNGTEWKVLAEDGADGLDLTTAAIVADNDMTMISKSGINTRFIKDFKNMVWNSSFEMYNPTTMKPNHWDTAGIVSADSNFWSTVSLKLQPGQEAISTGTISASWYGTIEKTTSRLSFYTRGASLKVQILNGVTPVTLEEIQTDLRIEISVPALTSIYSPESDSWYNSRYSVSFVHTGLENITIKFVNDIGNTDDIYIDGVQLEPDFTGEWPGLYSDGQYSEGAVRSIINSNTSIGLNVWTGTTAEYTAIVTKDPNTLYFLTA